MVAKIFVGGGTSRPLDRPSQTMISQASASPTGSNSPSAGRAQRRRRPESAGRAIGSALFQCGQFNRHGHSKNASRRGLQGGGWQGRPSRILPLWEKVARMTQLCDG